MKILFPADGELVNYSHCAQHSPMELCVPIRGITEPKTLVSCGMINVTAASDGSFTLPYCTSSVFNNVTLSCGEDVASVRFVCDFDKRKRYNFFIDDNVFFLNELVKKHHKSVFDNFYLAFLRKLHNTYGFKVTLNTFYHNSHAPENFTTSQLDTRYKSEFEDNSDWLRLAFHAYSEFPASPYGKAYPEKLPEHYQLVTSEIKRYAGEKTLIAPVIMHFFKIANKESRMFAAKAGMSCFTESERYWQDRFTQIGRPVLAQYNYQFNQLELQNLFVVNSFPKEVLLQKLENAYREPGRNFILCGTHEQYSYPFYFNYIPEHFDRLDAVIKSLTEHGFESVYFTETLLK